MSRDPWFVGVSAGAHDSSVAVLSPEGRLVFHTAEERIVRRRHAGGIPFRALDAALGVLPRTGRCLLVGADAVSQAALATSSLIGKNFVLAAESPGHHRCHAYSAFHSSSFSESAIVTCDGFGDAVSASIWVGRESGQAEEVLALGVEASLGGLWWTVNAHCGFAPRAEGTLMALAAQGSPTFLSRFESACTRAEDGVVESIDPSLLYNMSSLGSPLLSRLMPRRRPGAKLEPTYADLAASLQSFTESALLGLTRRARSATTCANLCAAGGVFLNCVANERIVRDRAPRTTFFHPAPGDDGLSIGAAYAGFLEYWNCRPPVNKNGFSPFLGCSVNEDLREAIEAAPTFGFRSSECRGSSLDTAAELLAHGNALGMLRGRAESGPRALGHRSILGDPRNLELKRTVSETMKHREAFRPVAPVVLEKSAAQYFDLTEPSPYMSRAVPCHPALEVMPAVRHADNTARVQTVSEESDAGFCRLLEGFRERCGVPVLMNTSFNVRGEGIVNGALDALSTAQRMELRYVIMDDWLFCRV